MKRFISGLVGVLALYLSVSATPAGDGGKVMDAVRKYTSEDYSGAVEILSGILIEEPGNDAAHYYMGLSKIGLGETDVAEAYLERAAELDPDNFWYKYRLAAYYGFTSRPDKAVGLYQALLKEYPKKSQIYYDLFELYVSTGKNEEALEVLHSIEDVFGESDNIVMQRFNLLLMMEKPEEAIRTLEQYNEKYSSPFVLTALADYEMSIYNEELAHKYYDEALDIFPDFSRAIIGKAEAYRISRKTDEYFKLMTAFVSSRNIPSPEKSAYLNALVSQSVPVYLKSVAPRLDSLLDQALAVHPADTLLLPLKGMFHLKIDDQTGAEQAFHQNVILNPDNQEARMSWCDLLSYLNKWELLAEESREAASLFPKNSRFVESEIFAMYNLKQWGEIIRLCQKVIRQFPDEKERLISAYSTMGDVYYMMEKKREAFKAYESVLKLDPDNVYVLNNYAYYLSLGPSRLKKAALMSKKTVDAEPDNATYLDTYAWILFLQGKPEEAKPLFKHAMLYGGKESVVILDHYAEVLYALEEYDLAFVYWNRIKSMDKKNEIPDLEEKIARRTSQMKKKK